MKPLSNVQMKIVGQNAVYTGSEKDIKELCRRAQREEFLYGEVSIEVKPILELPMNCDMGRVPYYHRIYVICWIRLWAALEGHKMDYNKYLTDLPLDPNAPAEYVWEIQSPKAKKDDKEGE